MKRSRISRTPDGTPFDQSASAPSGPSVSGELFDADFEEIMHHLMEKTIEKMIERR